MNYHLFQKGSQSVFSKKKSNQNQNHKIGKEHEHCTTFHYIVLLHTKSAFTAYQDKGCMHMHPQKTC